MEVPSGKQNKGIVCVYEFFATSFLVYAVLASGGNALAASLTVLALIILCDPISGAHFNPCVTIGVFMASKKLGENLVFFLMILLS